MLFLERRIQRLVFCKVFHSVQRERDLVIGLPLPSRRQAGGQRFAGLIESTELREGVPPCPQQRRTLMPEPVTRGFDSQCAVGHGQRLIGLVRDHVALRDPRICLEDLRDVAGFAEERSGLAKHR